MTFGGVREPLTLAGANTYWTIDTRGGTLLPVTDGTSDQTLRDFLLARIAEDEAVARVDVKVRFASTYPARVLADCEAKRRIVELCDAAPTEMPPYRAGLLRALRCLAEPYASHPDYRWEWRP